MQLLTITVWRVFNGSRMNPADKIFTDWKDFWIYVRDYNIQDKYTLIIKPFVWSEGFTGGLMGQPSKNLGFWTVDLMLKDAN